MIYKNQNDPEFVITLVMTNIKRLSTKIYIYVALKIQKIIKLIKLLHKPLKQVSRAIKFII